MLRVFILNCSVWYESSWLRYALWPTQLLSKQSNFAYYSHAWNRMSTAHVLSNKLWQSVGQTQWTAISVKLCSNIVQLKSSLSVETLQTCHLQQHHPNLSIRGKRQKQTGKRVLLPTAFRQSLTADLDCAKVITNAVECFLLWIRDHTLL